MKKGQSISINTIIVAAIALIVLVVIIAIFSGRVRIFGQGARDCGAQGGQCDTECEVFETNVPGTNCEDLDPPEKCCVELY